MDKLLAGWYVVRLATCWDGEPISRTLLEVISLQVEMKDRLAARYSNAHGRRNRGTAGTAAPATVRLGGGKSMLSPPHKLLTVGPSEIYGTGPTYERVFLLFS